MKVRAGDKLICSKPKKRFLKKDPEPHFIDGKIYEVTSVLFGNINTGIPDSILIIRNDKKSIRFLNNDEILPESNLGKIFMSIKQQRKLKIQKIEERRKKI